MLTSALAYARLPERITDRGVRYSRSSQDMPSYAS